MHCTALSSTFVNAFRAIPEIRLVKYIIVIIIITAIRAIFFISTLLEWPQLIVSAKVDGCESSAGCNE